MDSEGTSNRQQDVFKMPWHWHPVWVSINKSDKRLMFAIYHDFVKLLYKDIGH